jgi:hypothetical protein
MSQRHPFSTVSCFRRFVSRDNISHYFDRLICQRLYYDAEIAWMISWNLRRPSKMGDVVTLLFVHFNFIIQFRNMFLFLKSSTLHIMSNLCSVYWVLGYIMMLKLHEWSHEIWSKNVIFKYKNYVPHLLFHIQIIFFHN